jgi:hypothetical protein
MWLPGPPVRMLFNNLPQAGVIRTLQMDRVFGQRAMGLAHTWGDMPITGVIFIVLSVGTIGMHTGCRTPKGIRQEVAPLFI